MGSWESEPSLFFFGGRADSQDLMHQNGWLNDCGLRLPFVMSHFTQMASHSAHKVASGLKIWRFQSPPSSATAHQLLEKRGGCRGQINSGDGYVATAHRWTMTFFVIENQGVVRPSPAQCGRSMEADPTVWWGSPITARIKPLQSPGRQCPRLDQ